MFKHDRQDEILTLLVNMALLLDEYDNYTKQKIEKLQLALKRINSATTVSVYPRACDLAFSFWGCRVGEGYSLQSQFRMQSTKATFENAYYTENTPV